MTIYEIIGLSVSIGVSVLSIAISLIKAIKAKKANKVLTLWRKIPGYVIQAEQIFGSKTGIAKLEFVLSKLQTDCVRLNLDISDEDMKAQIEEILATPTTKKEKVEENKPKAIYHEVPEFGERTELSDNSGYGQI